MLKKVFLIFCMMIMHNCDTFDGGAMIANASFVELQIKTGQPMGKYHKFDSNENETIFMLEVERNFVELRKELLDLYENGLYEVYEFVLTVHSTNYNEFASSEPSNPKSYTVKATFHDVLGRFNRENEDINIGELIEIIPGLEFTGKFKRINPSEHESIVVDNLYRLRISFSRVVGMKERMGRKLSDGHNVKRTMKHKIV